MQFMSTKFTNLDGLKKSERKWQTENSVMRLKLVVVTMVIFFYGYIGCFSCVSCWSTISIIHFNSLICWYLIKWFRDKGFMKTMNIHVIIIYCQKNLWILWAIPSVKHLFGCKASDLRTRIRGHKSTLVFK